MARVTVEDCLGAVDNRFELILVASKRARQLARGTADAHLAWNDDKATVMALREIASGDVTRDILKQKDEPMPTKSERSYLHYNNLDMDDTF